MFPWTEKLFTRVYMYSLCVVRTRAISLDCGNVYQL